MQIQVNSGPNVHGGEDVNRRVQEIISASVDRFADRITRIEAHLSDENSAKGGSNDKRCVIEARVAGLQPIAVSHQAESMLLAIEGAAEKLQRALDSSLGRLNDRS
jgi:ribosome-associated translation inhibitor RaiA